MVSAQTAGWSSLPSHCILFSNTPYRLPPTLSFQHNTKDYAVSGGYNLEGMSREELVGQRAVSWTVIQPRPTDVDQDGSESLNWETLTPYLEVWWYML